MKKSILICILILTLSLCSSVSAADEWTEFTPADNSEPMECAIVASLGDNSEMAEALTPISEEDWSVGPEDAALTILEYADFECPYCSFAGLTLLAFQQLHPEDVRYVYRHFPLSFHTKAPMAAYAADAAGQQELFFEAEHFLYSTQNEWSALADLDAFDAWLRENIGDNIEGLDVEQWTKDYEDEALRANVDAAFDEVVATGKVNATPSFFLNYNAYSGDYDNASLEKFIELFKLSDRTYNECPLMQIDDSRTYRAIIDTSEGEITMDLFADKAPLAVNNFIFLAEEGWYDNVRFHRVVPGFVAQSGDPSGSGIGQPGYTFATEAHEVRYGEPGYVGMANSGVDKNGSQFFITYDLQAYYKDGLVKDNEGKTDGKLSDEEIDTRVQEKLNAMSDSYTIFGKVSEDSMATLEKITTKSMINSVKIEVK